MFDKKKDVWVSLWGKLKKILIIIVYVDGYVLTSEVETVNGCLFLIDSLH